MLNSTDFIYLQAVPFLLQNIEVILITPHVLKIKIFCFVLIRMKQY